jgi:hypothetical protein
MRRSSEEYIGIIAANIPCLKHLLEKMFRALGGNMPTPKSKQFAPHINGSHAWDDDVGYLVSIQGQDGSRMDSSRSFASDDTQFPMHSKGFTDQIYIRTDRVRDLEAS